MQRRDSGSECRHCLSAFEARGEAGRRKNERRKMSAWSEGVWASGRSDVRRLQKS
jgi:hypothetical protein